MTEADLQVLRDARAAFLANAEANLASAEALAAVLARAEAQATPVSPISEYIKAGDAAILLRVSKKTVLRRCKAGQGKLIGGLWYMRGSCAIGLECRGSVRSQRND